MTAIYPEFKDKAAIVTGPAAGIAGAAPWRLLGTVCGFSYRHQ